VRLHRASIAAVVLVLLLGITAQARSVGTALGARAPAFVGSDLDGDLVDLAALNAEGKFVMVDFWASWCGPCVYELPHVLAFLKSFDNPRFRMISCSLDTERTLGAMKKLIADKDIPYPVVCDGGGWKARLAQAWGVHAIPATFLVNPEGIIVMRNIRGEDGLVLVRRIVEAAPDYVPPEFAVESTIEADFSAFTTVVEMPAFAEGEYSFAYGYNYDYRGEDGQPVGVSGEVKVALTITESGDGARSIALHLEGEDEAASSAIKAEYKETGEWGRLSLITVLGHEVSYVRTALDYHEPALDADLNVGCIYARPPRPED